MLAADVPVGLQRRGPIVTSVFVIGRRPVAVPRDSKHVLAQAGLHSWSVSVCSSALRVMVSDLASLVCNFGMRKRRAHMTNQVPAG